MSFISSSHGILTLAGKHFWIWEWQERFSNQRTHIATDTWHHLQAFHFHLRWSFVSDGRQYFTISDYTLHKHPASYRSLVLMKFRWFIASSSNAKTSKYFTSSGATATQQYCLSFCVQPCDKIQISSLLPIPSNHLLIGPTYMLQLFKRTPMIP